MPPLSCPITEDDLNDELARIEALIEPERDLVIAPDPDGVTLTKELMKFEFPIVNADDGSPSARPPLSLDIPRASVGPDIPVTSLDESTWPTVTSLDWQMQFYTIGAVAVGYHRCGVKVSVIRSHVVDTGIAVSPLVKYDALDPNSGFASNVFNYGGIAVKPLPSDPIRDLLYEVTVLSESSAQSANLPPLGSLSIYRAEADFGSGSFIPIIGQYGDVLFANPDFFGFSFTQTKQLIRKYRILVPAGSATVFFRAHTAVTMIGQILQNIINHSNSTGNASKLIFDPRTFIYATGYTTG